MLIKDGRALVWNVNVYAGVDQGMASGKSSCSGRLYFGLKEMQRGTNGSLRIFMAQMMVTQAGRT